MALVQRFSVSQNEAGTAIYLTDDTGTYDAISNTGGYGAPNTERTDLALILIAKYKAIAGAIDLDIESYDPEIVTLFTMQGIEKDGHYEFKVYSVARKTGAETPSVNDFVYSFSTDQLQRWNGSAWVAAENSELEDNDAGHVTVDYPVLTDLYRAFNNVNKLYVSTSKSQSRSDLRNAISETSAMLNGTIALFAEGAFDQAQKNIEAYQSRVDTLNELS